MTGGRPGQRRPTAQTPSPRSRGAGAAGGSEELSIAPRTSRPAVVPQTETGRRAAVAVVPPAEGASQRSRPLAWSGSWASVAHVAAPLGQHGRLRSSRLGALGGHRPGLIRSRSITSQTTQSKPPWPRGTGLSVDQLPVMHNPSVMIDNNWQHLVRNCCRSSSLGGLQHHLVGRHRAGLTESVQLYDVWRSCSGSSLSLWVLLPHVQAQRWSRKKQRSSRLLSRQQARRPLRSRRRLHQRLRLCRASQCPSPSLRAASLPGFALKAEAKPAVVPQETDPPLSEAVAPQEEPKPAASKPAVAPQETGTQLRLAQHSRLRCMFHRLG